MDDVDRIFYRSSTFRVTFNSAHMAFTVAGHPCRGLTPIIRPIVPVGRHEWPTAGCRGCALRQHADARRATERDQLMVPKRDRGPVLQTKKRQRSEAGRMELISVGPAATTTDAADQRSQPPQCYGGRDARQHGLYIDSDIARFVADPQHFRLASADRCSIRLLEYLRDKLRLVVVATQVPIYSRRLNFATAIDVLAVDARTRTHLHLIEVKATRLLGGASVDSERACYRHDATAQKRRSRRKVGGLPLSIGKSTYWLHQLQLWAMATVLEQEYGITLASACVLRTSPVKVFRYPLDTLGFDATTTASLRRLFAGAAKKTTTTAPSSAAAPRTS